MVRTGAKIGFVSRVRTRSYYRKLHIMKLRSGKEVRVPVLHVLAVFKKQQMPTLVASPSATVAFHAVNAVVVSSRVVCYQPERSDVDNDLVVVNERVRPIGCA